MTSKNPWDTFSSVYRTVKNEANITSDNADNILIVWPVILDFIQKNGQKGNKLNALDFGCGTGSFAYKLYTLGYTVTGVDSSEGMINTAKTEFDKQINFLNGDSSLLSHLEKETFSIITSIMTFQFIKNIEETFKNIHAILKPGGLFIFAVFNPSFVKECLRTKTFFEDFNSFEKPKKGTFDLNGNKIPVYIRTAQEYNNLLQELNFESLLESYPPFTESFLKKYPISNLINESEYLILGYKKIL